MQDSLEGKIETIGRALGTQVDVTEANSSLAYFEVRSTGSDELLGLLMNADVYEPSRAQTPAFKQYKGTSIIIPVTPDEAEQMAFATQGSEAARDQGHGHPNEGMSPEQYAIGTNALRGSLNLNDYVERDGLIVPKHLERFGTEEHDGGHAGMPLTYAFPVGEKMARIDTKLNMSDRSLIGPKVSYSD